MSVLRNASAAILAVAGLSACSDSGIQITRMEGEMGRAPATFMSRGGEDACLVPFRVQNNLNERVRVLQARVSASYDQMPGETLDMGGFLYQNVDGNDEQTVTIATVTQFCRVQEGFDVALEVSECSAGEGVNCEDDVVFTDLGD